jgi:6-pyruvoyltetrahydropterin/6-carboxytetrahydropterin synthase
MKVTLVKKTSFSAGHRLFNPKLSDEQNEEIFGACSNPKGHGHNYTLEVHVSGEIDRETGMVINLKKLKKIVEDEIIHKVDHKNLNEDVDFMKGIIPTTENLGLKIFEVLDARLGSDLLSRVVIWETENNRVEVIADKGR